MDRILSRYRLGWRSGKVLNRSKGGLYRYVKALLFISLVIQLFLFVINRASPDSLRRLEGRSIAWGLIIASQTDREPRLSLETALPPR